MLTAEEKYRLLLQVSEAANSQIEIAAVLEAVVEGLEPAMNVKALAVTTVEDDTLVPHAVYIRGVERRQGDSFADIIARWMSLSGAEMPPKPHGSLPLAGTGTEYVARTGRAWICEDLTQGSRFPEDARLLAAGVRSYVRVPLKVRDQFVGSLAFSRGTPGPFPPQEVDVFEALARPIRPTCSVPVPASGRPPGGFGTGSPPERRIQRSRVSAKESPCRRSTPRM